MASGFRISLGNPIAHDYSGSDPFLIGICTAIEEKANTLKNLSYSQLSSLKDDEYETLLICGKEVCFTTFVEKNRVKDGLWVVIQAYYPTWKSPNHISSSGFAKVFVDGFSIDKFEKFSKINSGDLYEFA